MVATNKAAEQAGLHDGLSLTDARALCPALETAIATPEEDRQSLERLALWCLRFSPLIAAHPPDGLAIDITGCAHLFGGEKSMLHSFSEALDSFGISHHLALADTIGGAWALARYGKERCSIIPQGAIKAFLAPLPLAALRLDPIVTEQLKQLGLRKICHLTDAPQPPLTSRFGPEPVLRLRQALGRESEIFNPLFPPPAYSARYPFEEPVLHQSALEAALERLTKQMEILLKETGKGSRELHLRIFRIDGHVTPLQIRTSRLCQEAPHMALLFQESLNNFHEDLDTGFGIDLMLLEARQVEEMPETQHELPQETRNRIVPPEADHAELAQLLDRFGNRFGFDRITRFTPRESYIPERSFQAVSVTAAETSTIWPESSNPFSRPFLFFTPPEPITVLAEVPDGPPLRFKWRRRHHHITRAEGPERLAPEWWDVQNNDALSQTRDYFRVENTDGHRFWLFRAGLYDRDDDIPRWYMQGLFP